MASMGRRVPLAGIWPAPLATLWTSPGEQLCRILNNSANTICLCEDKSTNLQPPSLLQTQELYAHNQLCLQVLVGENGHHLMLIRKETEALTDAKTYLH